MEVDRAAPPSPSAARGDMDGGDASPSPTTGGEGDGIDSIQIICVVSLRKHIMVPLPMVNLKYLFLCRGGCVGVAKKSTGKFPRHRASVAKISTGGLPRLRFSRLLPSSGAREKKILKTFQSYPRFVQREIMDDQKFFFPLGGAVRPV